MSAEAKDPYTTVCFHCPDGPTRKENYMFTPSELLKYRPKCRACVSEYNARKMANPGAKPGYGWRNQPLGGWGRDGKG